MSNLLTASSCTIAEAFPDGRGSVWKRAGKASLLLALAAAVCPAARAQVGMLQIQVIGGEGSVHTPGARDARAIAVAVTDETGRPVAGAAVSFHLPDQGPSGTFVNGLHTDVALTDDHGRAAVRSIEFNRVPGRFEIRIVASKEQARAGTISFQYIAGTGVEATAPAEVAKWTSGSGHHRKKWFIIAAAAGLVAAAGTAALKRSTAEPAAASASVLSIGPPSVTVGKP